MLLLILVLELFLLFLTSRLISRSLFTLFFRIFRKESIAARGVTLVFFPGTVVHELAHYGMAKMLFVSTGKISFTPELRGESIRLGSVQVAKSDILRRLLIGVAPIIVGVIILSVATYYLLPFLYNVSFSWQYFLLLVVYLYGVFVITNTMFSSRKDMEGFLAVGVFLTLVTGIVILAGMGDVLLNGLWYVIESDSVQRYSQKIFELLLIPLAINGLIIGVGKLMRR